MNEGAQAVNGIGQVVNTGSTAGDFARQQQAALDQIAQNHYQRGLNDPLKGLAQSRQSNFDSTMRTFLALFPEEREKFLKIAAELKV